MASKPSATLLILLAALLLHLPGFWNSHFFADDFIQHFVFSGNKTLEERGFSGAEKPASLGYALENQFHFFNPHKEQYAALRESGALPWWLPEQAQIHFWRPLSTLSHWLDYQLWPENIHLMHAHNMVVVLAFWLACAVLFRRLLPLSVANIALLLLVLDVSIIFPLDWIAARNSLWLLLLTPCLILALNRQNRSGYVLALLIFSMALLVAEAGVALLGFVIAWLLFMANSCWRFRVLLLACFGLITVLWRWYYQSQAYGAFGISHYIDPLYSGSVFWYHAFAHYPVLAIHLLTGAEASDFYLRGNWQYVLVPLGYLLLALPLWAACKLGVANRQWWFWYIAALLSLQPYTALALSDPRISTLPFIAYAAALAIIIQAFWQQHVRHWLLSGFVRVSSLLHVVLSAMALLAWALLPSANSDLQDARFNNFDTQVAYDQHVLIANTADPFRLLYHPYRAAYHQLPMPLSVRALLLAETQVTVARTGQYDYVLSQQGGMLLTPKAIYRNNPARVSGVEGMTGLLMGFFHDGNERFYTGQQWHYQEASITLQALHLGRPQRLAVRLHNDNIRWLFWDWHSRQYLPMADIAIGETVAIKGKHDNTQ